MFRRSAWKLMSMGALFGSSSNTKAPTDEGLGRSRLSSEDTKLTKLWFKPETRDERIKEHVPEVIEESLAEQRALLSEQTLRDQLVEHGHKIIVAIENKAPTPSIAPSLGEILKAYGLSQHLISQRALSYLIYPTTSAAATHRARGEMLPELISAFPEHFKEMIESIEQDGTYVNSMFQRRQAKQKQLASPAEQKKAEDTKASGDAEEDTAKEGEEAEQVQAEPPDVTMFVKVMSGMSLANLHCNDLSSAVKCCDAALDHVIDANRKGGVLALKSGLLIRDKRYEEAAAAALLAVEASGNLQGYLHGATALRFLGRKQDAVELLDSGLEQHPANPQLEGIVSKIREEEEKLALKAELAPKALESGDRPQVSA